MTAVIRFDDVQRWFGDQDVLRGLSFEVRPGEVYALLGRNGEGKTTAMNVLLGFLQPLGGRSEILGCDSQQLGPAERSRIGYVSEGHRLYPWMRVREVLEFEAGTREPFDRAYADDAVRRLDLPLDRRVRRLSRGMRAQLALLVAMAGHPEVMVLDDPALGLDAVMRREFLEAMIDLLGEEGRSVLFSSHVLSDVERIADRVGILKDGRLIVDVELESLRRRVEKRFARANGDTAALAGLPGVLAARPRRDGVELLLADVDAERERALREHCAHLSEPATPDLEEIFIDLTARSATEEVGA